MNFSFKSFMAAAPFLLLFLLGGCTSWGLQTQSEGLQPAKIWQDTASSSQTKVHFLRLKPGQNISDELKKYCEQKHIYSGTILSAVGSLSAVSIRYANQPQFVALAGPFEIVSLVGMIGADKNDLGRVGKEGGNTQFHFHISVSNKLGQTLGGHLGSGSEVYTTLEIALLESPEISFSREIDKTYGYKELVFKKD